MNRCKSIAVTSVIVLSIVIGSAFAQVPPTSAGPVDPALIEDLVAANRILTQQGVLDESGHVSIRHPANPNRYLMARSLSPALVTAEDIMEFDLDSNPVDQRGRRLALERFIHGEVYKVTQDVNAVIHSHSPSVIPFSVTSVPLRPIKLGAAFLWTGVPVFETRNAGVPAADMLIRNRDLGKALANSLGDKRVALLRGHGKCRRRFGRANRRKARYRNRNERSIADYHHRPWRRSHQLYFCRRGRGTRQGSGNSGPRLGALEK